MHDINPSDWTLLTLLRELALERFCRRVPG
jgi:hypothetical protein